MKQLIKFYWQNERETDIYFILFSMLCYAGIMAMCLSNPYQLKGFQLTAEDFASYESSDFSHNHNIALFAGTMMIGCWLSMIWIFLRTSMQFNMFRKPQNMLLPVSLKDKFLALVMVITPLRLLIAFLSILVVDPLICSWFSGSWQEGYLLMYIQTFSLSFVIDTLLPILWTSSVIILLSSLLSTNWTALIFCLSFTALVKAIDSLSEFASSYIEMATFNVFFYAILIITIPLNIWGAWYFFNTRRDVNYITLQKN